MIRLPWRPLLVAVLALALGWVAGTASSTTRSLRVVGEFEGTVSLVSEGGTKLCLELNGGGGQRCGVIYGRPDATPPAVGAHVAVVVGVLQIGAGVEEEIFMLAPVAAPRIPPR